MIPMHQFVEWLKPTSPTSEELELVEKVKPGEYEVYWERLENITLEAKEVFIRSGITEMLRAGDCICGIHNAAGDLVLAWSGTTLHAVVAQLPIKHIIKHIKHTNLHCIICVMTAFYHIRFIKATWIKYMVHGVDMPVYIFI